MIRCVLLDVAGVIYQGDRVLPGAAAAVERLHKAGLSLRFVSNTTRSPKQAVLDRLRRFGIPVGENELFTPAQAACAWLRDRGYAPHLLVHPALEGEFSDIPDGDKRAVVLGDVGTALNYTALNNAFRALDDGAPFLALANNRTFRDEDGKRSLDAGAFVAALEFAGRRKAIVMGKPAKDFFLAALADMEGRPEDAAMIGDDAEADIAGALDAGLGTALLVRTGKYHEGDETRFEPQPTAVVDDIAAAADWILKHRG